MPNHIDCTPRPSELDALWATCRKFIKENRISCGEAIYQTDHVIENSYAFVEAICEIVGYEEIA